MKSPIQCPRLCHWLVIHKTQVQVVRILTWKVTVEELVAQSCPTLCDPMDCMDCSLLGSPFHGILQVSVLEWVVSTCACIKSELMGESLCPCCFLGFNELQVWSLGLEDPLEEGMATHSSILAWRIPMDRGAWPLQYMGLQSRTWLRQLSTHLAQWTSYWNTPSWVSLVPKTVFQTKVKLDGLV